MKWTNDLLDDTKDDDNSTIVSDYTDVKELVMMVLNINENNLNNYGDVLIGKGYLAQMKDLARDIIGDDSVC